MDPNVIAGMFTWDAELPWPNRELDFEFARWSDPEDPTNAQFVIQPFTTPGNWLRYRVEPDENDPYLTQVMTWQKGRVDFKTARGRFDSPRIPEEAVIAAWTRTGDAVPEPRKENIRINLVAAGPIRTIAAKSIPDFQRFEHLWDERSPLKWDVNDPVPAAQAAVALLSDWFPKTTAEIIHVDGGFHAMGG